MSIELLIVFIVSELNNLHFMEIDQSKNTLAGEYSLQENYKTHPTMAVHRRLDNETTYRIKTWSPSVGAARDRALLL